MSLSFKGKLRCTCLYFLTTSFVSADNADPGRKKTIRVAIIGGGISESFTAKYLFDYDTKCKLDITLFDAPTVGNSSGSNHGDGNDNGYKSNNSSTGQGSRVNSLTLSDGTVVELGASIIFEGNKLVSDMIDGDPSLIKVQPHSPRSSREDGLSDHKPELHTGMGIYNGFGDDDGHENEKAGPWALLLTKMTPDERTKSVLWRYNLDLWRVKRATTKSLSSFNLIYELIASNHDATFFESPNDVWRAVGLAYPASTSYDDYLDRLGLPSFVPWWKFLINGQGIARKELYTAMNICNNNQNNAQMTALAALVNSAASMGGLYAIDGGNDKLVSSAFLQASETHEKVCRTKDLYGPSKIRKVSKKIRTLISDFEQGMELFGGDGKLLGHYDIVVLAAPLQFSNIQFLAKGSLFDKSVLHPMTLNGMVDGKNSDANEHGHRSAMGGQLPSSASRPYTQVVTTVVSGGRLSLSHFSLDDEHVPKSILVTEQGRQELGISSISQITNDVYKIFSSNELTVNEVKTLLGDEAQVEYTKVWGGKNGGATPAFDGAGESTYSTKFLLYDGGHGEGAYSDGSALYYTNAMEAAVSAMEISAIGSRLVSKLIARRLGLLKPSSDYDGGEL
mmetsp:Transcript_17443/g.25432  ORF Transcript_17443/g.25432 Transcript_17443/m.25432 type:complete len:620 (-) Transcript_17443:533-2392(-)